MRLLTDRTKSKTGRATIAGAAIMATVATLTLGAGAGAAIAAPSFDVDLQHDDNEIQRVVVGASGGQFKLTFAGDTTPDLAVGVSRANLQAALNALPSISAGGGSVSVTGVVGADETQTGDTGADAHYFVIFDGGALAHTDVPSLIGTRGAAPLTGMREKVTVKTVHAAGISRSDRRVDYAVAVTPTDVSGVVTVTVELPSGQDAFVLEQNGGWDCVTVPAIGTQRSTATCTRSDIPPVGVSYPTLSVIGRAFFDPEAVDAPDHAAAVATATGGGAAPTTDVDEFDYMPLTVFDIDTFDTAVYDFGDADYTTAGGHPFAASAGFRFPFYRTAGDLTNPAFGAAGNYSYHPVEHVRDIVTDLPRGFVGNPLSVPELCRGLAEVLAGSCPLGSVVGGITLDVAGFGHGLGPLAIYAIEPERGELAEFAFAEGNSRTLYTLLPRLRPEDGYAVKVVANPVPTTFPLTFGVEDVTLCSFGADSVRSSPPGFDGVLYFDGCKKADEPGANSQPFITIPPHCAAQPPTTRLTVNSWENPGVFKSRETVDPPLTDCGAVQFDPEIDLQPTSQAADSATGLDVGVSVPTDGLLDNGGTTQAHLKKTVVELPEGVSVNPSGATGLEACSDEQLGLGTDVPTSCPDGSVIGTVEISTPVIEERLHGAMVLRTPKSTDPQSGDMFRLAVVVRNDERGLLVKLPGSAVADPQTGRLTATFDDNPELPFSDLEVKVKGGERGTLAMPQRCGAQSIDTTLTPWGDPAAVSASNGFTVGGDCGYGFAPKLAAGMSTSKARSTGDFSFKFSREDGEQWVDGLTAKLPQGLLAKVKDVPLCASADAAAGTCGAGSRIGTVDGTAGSGAPFVLERKGDVYLTEGYKGCAYGLSVKVPVVAGPFDGSSPENDLGNIVVRQALCVDPATAEVSAVSDPFPTIWHGIPLRVRSVTVKVDRAGFMVNPSDCTAGQVAATLHSVPGNTADVSSPFQATGCSALPYKPRIGLRLTGKRQVTTGKHPGVKALVRQNGVGEAGIEQAVVRLPRSIALDPENAQALCEFVDGTKPDLEKRCPKGSVVGRARATSPLLNKPLVGNVYFVKNVRIDPKTGNSIRTLPMIVVALRGEVAVNLEGESSTTRNGRLVNTFDGVPDAPISQFNLNIDGGENGILAVTRTRKSKINLCASRQTAEADTDGQNGRRRDFDIAVKTPCTKKQAKKAKRAAAKARAGSRRG